MPGATLTYTLRLTNTGNVTDTFNLTKSGNFYTVTLPASVGPLMPITHGAANSQPFQRTRPT